VTAVRDVLVKAIMIGERLRPLRDSLITELTESMATRGLIHPISITYPNGQATPQLVVGAHRLEAAKRLKWETIASDVVAFADADQAKLVEIDENLIRGELSPAERAIHIAARKRLYEAIHPETKHGGAPGAGRGKRKRSEESQIGTFVSDTAAKTGKSRTAVARDTTRAKHIPALADAVGTSLDQGEELDALAALPEESQGELIARAKQGEKVSAKGAAKRYKRAAKEQKLGEATRAAAETLGERLYNVIYADPPWRFEPYSRETGMDRAADNHYPTMTLDELRALKLPAAADCALFMWATRPMLSRALGLLEHWGFEYRTCWVWHKAEIGTGYWNRDNAEILLLGVRGNVPAPTPGEQYPACVRLERGKHSEKPEYYAAMIEDLFPTLPRGELFARRVTEGFDAWGNEIAP
jgi:N6-adenosine-specific RNA methylase IME4